METATAPAKVIKKQYCQILPFINEADENFGLTKYSMVVFEGANQTESLGCIGEKNHRRYLTGLNEFAPEVQREQDPEKKKQVISDIRRKVAFLEAALDANTVEVDDTKFWEKIKKVHPTNYEFWEEVTVKVGNEPVFLDPEIAKDLIIICGIEAGGFSLVAKSWEDAKTSPIVPKFYLHKELDTVSSKTEVTKIKNMAIGTLHELFNRDPKKLFYVVKLVDPNSYRYTQSTANDTIYEFLDKFITGNGSERSAKAASEYFNSVCKMNMEDLKIRAVIADASFYKIIQTKGDGMIYHSATTTMIGKNHGEVVTYFKNPLYSDLWQTTLAEVEKHWKQ